MTYKDQPIPVARVIELQREFAALYHSTNLISLRESFVHIAPEGMADIAPLAEWSLNNDRHDETFPYEHSIIVSGVMFQAITAERITLTEAVS